MTGSTADDRWDLILYVDGAVKQILAVPMSAFKDVAGDWNKDGTRDHQIRRHAGPGSCGHPVDTQHAAVCAIDPVFDR